MAQTSVETSAEADAEFIEKLMKDTKRAMETLGPLLGPAARHLFKGMPGMDNYITKELPGADPCESCKACAL